MTTFWRTCPAGHDLTADNAWLYRNGGRRECRACAEAERKGKPRARRAKHVDLDVKP